jgi:hypothetical protein
MSSPPRKVMRMSATPAPTYEVLVETSTIKEWRNQQTFNVLDSEEEQELRESLCSPDHDSDIRSETDSDSGSEVSSDTESDSGWADQSPRSPSPQPQIGNNGHSPPPSPHYYERQELESVAPASEDDLWRDMANALNNSRLKNEEDAHLISSLTNALESAAMLIDSSKDEIWQLKQDNKALERLLNRNGIECEPLHLV